MNATNIDLFNVLSEDIILFVVLHIIVDGLFILQTQNKKIL